MARVKLRHTMRCPRLKSSYLEKSLLLQILNNLSVKHLIKLILHENDVKLLKFKKSPV